MEIKGFAITVVIFGILVGAFGAVVNQAGPAIPDDCGVCMPEECQEPRACVAGVVMDRCHCCQTCAKTEYEMCRHEQVPGSESRGVCGENLECRLRSDLHASDRPEALCYCQQNEAICGDDGETQATYNNQCQLRAMERSLGSAISIVGKGPCDARPEIVTSPENTHNHTGDNVVLACEARGFPVPKIEWTWTRVDGEQQLLPNDDPRVSVNMRGGPERFSVTGWLQIMDVQKQHEGDYTCRARNEQGQSEETARVKVTESGKDRKERRQKQRDDDL